MYVWALSTGHRAHNVYIGVHLPGFKRRSHHRRHRHHHKNGIGKDPNASSTDDDDRPSESIYVLYCTVFFLFSALSALVCPLFRRLFVSVTETSKMLGMLKLYAAEYSTEGRRLT